MKRKLAFQGDGSLLIQELKPDTKSSFLPQITNDPITVKFLTIFYIVVRDTKLYSGPELPKSIIFNLVIYFKKRDVRRKFFSSTLVT